MIRVRLRSIDIATRKRVSLPLGSGRLLHFTPSSPYQCVTDDEYQSRETVLEQLGPCTGDESQPEPSKPKRRKSCGSCGTATPTTQQLVQIFGHGKAKPFHGIASGRHYGIRSDGEQFNVDSIDVEGDDRIVTV